MQRDDNILPEGETTPMADRAGIMLAGPVGAFCAGLLLFGLFVYGASHSEMTAEQQTAQQAPQTQQAPPKAPQAQPPETTGQAPTR